MKKSLLVYLVLFVGIVIFLLTTAGNARNDVIEEYNSLPGNTKWKIVTGVVTPAQKFGFKLISADGEETYWTGNPSEWNINLETGEVR